MGPVRFRLCGRAGRDVGPFVPMYEGRRTVADEEEAGAGHMGRGLRTAARNEVVQFASANPAAGDLSTTVYRPRVSYVPLASFVQFDVTSCMLISCMPCRATHKWANKTQHQLMARMQMWLEQWNNAGADIINEEASYDPSTQPVYLQWYVPRTRTRLLRVGEPPVPAPRARTTDLYSDRPSVALHNVVSILYET